MNRVSETLTQPTRSTGASNADPTALERFIEQMGLMCEADNLPRISGRIFGLFLIVGTSLSLGQVAERLQISRASASTNMRILANAGVLERVGVRNDRQDYYQLTPNPFLRLLTVFVTRMRRGAAFFAEAAETLHLERPDTSRRLRDMAALHRACGENFERLLGSFCQEPIYHTPSTRDEVP